MPHKRRRRGRQEVQALRSGLAALVEQHRPLTIRHLFYLAVAAALITKAEVDYNNVVIRLTGQMREDWLRAYRGHLLRREDSHKVCQFSDSGEVFIPFGEEFIVDGSRWIIKPRSFTGIEAALRNGAASYRRAQWDESDKYVVFVCEKDAIANLASIETADYDVPLAIIKGMSSKTFLWDTALSIDRMDKEIWLYFLGDHDDAGDTIIKAAVERIRRYANTDKTIHWQKLAVTQDQIREFGLPLRPPKTSKEKVSEKFKDGCVEIDALPPQELRRIVRAAIEQHIDQRALEVLKVAERSERELFERIAGNLPAIRRTLGTA
jgi:hypothetical protein